MRTGYLKNNNLKGCRPLARCGHHICFFFCSSVELLARSRRIMLAVPAVADDYDGNPE